MSQLVPRCAIAGALALALAACGTGTPAAPATPTGAPTDTPAASATSSLPEPTVTVSPTAVPIVVPSVTPSTPPAPTSTPAPAATTEVPMPDRPADEPVSPTSASQPSRLTPRPVATRIRRVEPPSGPGEGVTGEVPAELMQRIKQDLAGRTGADPAAMRELIGAFVEWPNSALGCPQPGVEYLQVITPGYRVVLEVGGTTYDYRSDERGFFMLCTP